MRKPKDLIKKLPKHIAEGLLFLLLPIPVYILFGLFIGSFVSIFITHGSFLHNVCVMTLGGYVYFGGASLAIYGLLRLITKPSIDLHFGFGPGLFYGTFFLSAILRNFIHTNDFTLYIISFAFAALVCYIIWIKRFKVKDEN